MKRLVLALVCFISLTCLADRVDDRRAMGRNAICQLWGNFATNGAASAFKGVPLKYKYVTPGEMTVLLEMAEHGMAPRDAIYISDDGLTDQERTFWQDAVASGYNRMKAMMTAKPDMEEPDWQVMVPAMYGICMNSQEM